MNINIDVEFDRRDGDGDGLMTCDTDRNLATLTLTQFSISNSCNVCLQLRSLPSFLPKQHLFISIMVFVLFQFLSTTKRLFALAWTTLLLLVLAILTDVLRPVVDDSGAPPGTCTTFAILGHVIMSHPWIVRVEMTNYNIVGVCFECVKILHLLSST